MTAYDYLIIGGGTAGSVLAGRLSERPGVSVCVVEAGPDYAGPERPDAFKRPWGEPVMEAEYFWAYSARYHRTHEDPMFTIRGRVTGGSSTINGAEWVRGVAEDYDSWGSELWAYPAVLNAYKKIENDIDYPDDVHGTAGPVPVRRYPREIWSPLHQACFDAARVLGYDEKPDFNRSEGAGIGPTPMNVDSAGMRVDAARAYLDPARERPNLTIIPDATVQRIVFSGDIAIGADVEVDGQVSRMEAAEVIVCAGALASPHLLMLSGIGPADELRPHEIAVVADLPGVGRNLQDHPSISLNVEPSDAVDRDSGAPASPFIITYTSTGSPHRNDMVLTLPWYRGDEMVTTIRSLSCRLNAPAARGSIKLESADPADAPSLDYRYLENETDRGSMREGIRRIVELARQAPLAGLIANMDRPSDDVLRSDAALDAWIQVNIGSVLHSAGTCKLGADDDPHAVVDDHLRVRGVRGLRVCDLSVAPTVPRSNTGSNAFMIGERLAELILEEEA